MKEIYKNAAALVPAAGMGTRLGLGPKAFLKINGKTLLRIVVEKLSQCVPRIIAAVPPGFAGQGECEVGDMAEVIEGGETRHRTVLMLLEHSSEPIVLVHEITRPFASTGLIRNVITASDRTGAAMSAIASYIPAILRTGENVTDFISKDQFFLPQSPQVFHREILEQAYEYGLNNKIEKQTTWQLVKMIGKPITVVPGEEKNIKITTPFDWAIASQILAAEIE